MSITWKFFSGIIFTLLMSVAPTHGISDSDFNSRYGLTKDPEPVLREILSTEEYIKNSEPSIRERINELKRRFWRYIQSQLNFQIPEMPWLKSGFDYLKWILGSFVLAVLIVLAYLVFNRFARRGGKKPEQAENSPYTEVSHSLSGSTLKEMALKCASSGDYNNAIILLFRFLLRHLDEQGRISLRASKTNREIMSDLSNDALTGDMFSKLVHQFNRVRYGGHTTSKEDYQEYMKSTEILAK